jgi:hypothetical protein
VSQIETKNPFQSVEVLIDFQYKSDKIGIMQEYTPEHRVNRREAALLSEGETTSDFVNLPPAECVEIVWELTRELWSLTGKFDAEQRLQRNVAVLKRP